MIASNPRARYIVNPYWSGAALTLTEYAEGHKTEMKKLFLALDEAVRTIRSDPQGSLDVLPSYTALSASLARNVGVYDYVAPSERPNVAAIQRVADMLADMNLVPKRVDVARMCLTADQL